ncbi:MAG: efflux RND transporter periplasmic adaptor subunit, partial [Helicobacter sp.]|nr:efflux RND transporter periplasmic adaptor subunit [Helicobacter sp.]
MSILAKDIYAKLYPKPAKRKWLLLTIIVLCPVIVLLWWWLYPSTPKYIYKTTSPKTATITQIVSAAGTLSPIDTVEVGSQISGRIQEVLVD